MNINQVLSIFIILAVITGFTYALPGKADDRGPLEKITFIHYKKGHAKPPWAGGGSGGGTLTCYGFLAKDAKWKTTEPFSINPTNSQGLSESLIVDATLSGVTAWESPVSFNVFGNHTVDYSASYNNGNFDGVNTLSFGSISGTNTIGVTTVWGYFSGAPQTRELLEWDMLLDETDFAWGNANLNPTKMDAQNIITHELGHSAGMGDLYESGCSEETMYGYSGEGETKKRTLAAGDIAGMQKLYN